MIPATTNSCGACSATAVFRPPSIFIVGWRTSKPARGSARSFWSNCNLGWGHPLMNDLGAEDRVGGVKGPAAQTNRMPWRRGPRALPLEEWPEADQSAWRDACRPGFRLKPGGAASLLGDISRDDFARRYGAFL